MEGNTGVGCFYVICWLSLLKDCCSTFEYLEINSGIKNTAVVCACLCVRVCWREEEVEIERFDAVTAANYCCSIFHTVCFISCPVERDRDSLFLTNSHLPTHSSSGVTRRRKMNCALITEFLQGLTYISIQHLRTVSCFCVCIYVTPCCGPPCVLGCVHWYHGGQINPISQSTLGSQSP